ncbi:MAG TPA: NapC/NirT family cytochrome c [Thermoleophilia bacterium]|nr:NapC/NirT family cytochrome c [Thermoleophilia bacterium]
MSKVKRCGLIVAGVAVVLVASAFAAAEYTGRTAFCVSCHEMQPYYDSWQQFQHTEAGCADCHIPKGLVSFTKTKLFAFREVYVHVLGQVKAPLAVTRKIPDSSCTQCHNSLPRAQTADATFDHTQHSAPCVRCHVRLVHKAVTPPVYVDPGTMGACFVCHDGATAAKTCSLCHTAPHDDQGACDTCHGVENWSPSGFDHPFPLEGGHAKATCEQCHTKTTGADGSITFSKASPECVSCHGDEHGGLTDCGRCHTPQGWTPANFSHPRVGEHIPGGEHRLSCQDCHASGFGAATCTPCHDGVPRGD